MQMERMGLTNLASTVTQARHHSTWAGRQCWGRCLGAIRIGPVGPAVRTTAVACSALQHWNRPRPSMTLDAESSKPVGGY